MQLLAIQPHPTQLAELQAKFPDHTVRPFATTVAAEDFLTAPETVVFDFGLTDHPATAAQYAGATVPVFVEASRTQLAALSLPAIVSFFGFCGLPTLLNRPLLELSIPAGAPAATAETLAATCAQLGTDYRVVADRVGLATPRVLAMLVNEACFTLQEQTASATDIDRGLQQGTNYPRGPLAWGDALGPARVVALLDAVWADTHDPRYRVCPLLRTRAQLGQPLSE